MEKKPAALGTTGWCDSTNKRPHYDGEGKLSDIATHYSRNAANYLPQLALPRCCIATALHYAPVHHFVMISYMLADYYYYIS